MIEVGSKVPLPLGAHDRARHGRVRQQERVHRREEARVAVPQQKDEQRERSQLDADPPSGVIVLLADVHDRVHHDEEVGVQRTNVVKDVGVAWTRG